MIWLLAVGIILVILLIIMVAFKKHKGPTDYYALFIMGLIWMAIGIPFQNYMLFLIGVIFSIAGLAHKKEWKADQKAWAKLPKKQRYYKLFLMIMLVLFLIIAFMLFVLNKPL